MRRYEWQKAPDNLKTEAQLKKLWLKPGPRRGVTIYSSQTNWVSLYDLAEATPYTAEEITAVKEAARVARHAARYRTCIHCNREVRKEKWDSYWKACDDCRDDVEAAFFERERAKERAEALRHQTFMAESRDEAIKTARGWLLMGSQVVILDTETTGLQPAEIVEIAVIGIDGKELLNTRIRPLCEIEPGAFAVHGISKEMLVDAPLFAQIYPRLVELLEGKTVITYNAEFDRGIVTYCCDIQQLEPVPATAWQCAMLVYASYYGEWNNYWGSFKWQKLSGGDHSALGDCRATLDLIKRMATAHLSDCKCEACKVPTYQTTEG